LIQAVAFAVCFIWHDMRKHVIYHKYVHCLHCRLMCFIQMNL